MCAPLQLLLPPSSHLDSCLHRRFQLPASYKGANVSILYWQGPIQSRMWSNAGYDTHASFTTEIHNLHPEWTTGGWPAGRLTFAFHLSELSIEHRCNVQHQLWHRHGVVSCADFLTFSIARILSYFLRHHWYHHHYLRVCRRDGGHSLVHHQHVRPGAGARLSAASGG